jgi:hypothetical protein
MTEDETNPSEWDREARLVGRLAIMESAIAALIAQAPDVEHVRKNLTVQLDLMWGRNPPCELSDAAAEIARGAESGSKLFLAACDRFQK